MQRLTSLFISYWQSHCVCRGDSKEKVDINLNYKRWLCTLRSRSSPSYLFHVLRCRVCASVYFIKDKEKMTDQDTPPLPSDAVSLHSKGRTVNIMKPIEDQSNPPQNAYTKIYKHLRSWCCLCLRETDVAFYNSVQLDYAWTCND